MQRPAAGSSAAPQHGAPQHGAIAPGQPDGGASGTGEAGAIDAENRAALAAMTPEQVRLRQFATPMAGSCWRHV